MRILAGEYKGRNLLPPPASSDTRPMTAAAKKSLFDILAGRLIDAAVADLYCGTGTLGLEAMSRGARRCYFADRDRLVLSRLRRNIETLGLFPRCVVWCGDVPVSLAGWLEGLDCAIDVAFVDPPFSQVRQSPWQQAADRIFVPLSAHLSADGVVVLRLPSELRVSGDFGPLALQRTRQYGGMKVLLLGRRRRADGGAG